MFTIRRNILVWDGELVLASVQVATRRALYIALPVPTTPPSAPTAPIAIGFIADSADAIRLMTGQVDLRDLMISARPDQILQFNLTASNALKVEDWSGPVPEYALPEKGLDLRALGCGLCDFSNPPARVKPGQEI